MKPAFAPRSRALALASLMPAAVMLAATFGASPARAMDASQAETLVATASHDAVHTFAGAPLAPQKRAQEIRRMLASYTDLALVSHEILGHHWTQATPAQRRDFQGLLESYAVATWAAPLSMLPPGETVTVKGATAQGAKTVVHSLAASPGEPATPVDWTVAPSVQGRPVIADVSVGGISVVDTLHADFTAILTHGGLPALLAALHKKIGTN